MLFGGELIGALVVTETGDSPRRFTDADARLLSLFAGQAAAVVRNARLLDETQMRAMQLGLAYDAALTINRHLDPRVQLKFLFKIAMTALRADNAAFFRHDPARGEVFFESGVGANTELELVKNLRVRVGEERGILGVVAQNRLPVYVPDVSADPRWIASDPDIRSVLWVPVKHESELSGVLTVASVRVNAFTLHDERLLVLFANQIAVAMENARLFQETQARVRELEAVNKISTALRVAETLDKMLPLLLDETLAALNTRAGAIWLHDAADQQLHHVVGRDWLAQMDTTPMQAGEGIGGKVFASGETHHSREFVSDPFTRESSREQIQPGWGGAVIPIRTTAEIIGVLFVGVPLPREMQASEVHLLTTIAEIAGNAIHRMRLTEQTTRQVERLAALHTIDTAISSSVDLRVILNILLEHVTTQLGVDAAAVLLLNPHLNMLEFIAGRGFRGSGITRLSLRLGEDYAGKAVLERRLVSIPNLKEADRPFTKTEPTAGEDFIAYFGVPLIVKGQAKGILEIFHRAPIQPDSEWLKFLESLAGQAAIAIDNAALFEGLQRSNIELALAYDATIEGWSHALDLRDKETEGHTQRVTEITLRLAKAMGIGDAELVHVRRGALLHDIGKMGVPDAILLKPDKLSEAEWEIMRQHPVFAYEMLAPIAYLCLALDIPYCHHEKWDGTGYPRGLKSEQIPLAARLFAVVDVWDALRSDRPYRKAWDEEKTREHLREQAGKHFDPNVVEAFMQLLR